MKYQDPELLSVEKVAEMLCISTTRVHKLWKDGLLPAPIKCEGLPLLWIKQDIVRLVNYIAEEYRHYFPRESKVYQPSPGINHPAFDPVRNELLAEWTGSGIYFLVKDGSVVYVGSSLNTKRRIEQHRTGTNKMARKDFDSSFALPVPLEELIEAEKKWVALLNPVLNVLLRPTPPDMKSMLEKLDP